MRKERLLVMRPERTHDQISTQLCIFSIFLNFVYYGFFLRWAPFIVSVHALQSTYSYCTESIYRSTYQLYELTVSQSASGLSDARRGGTVHHREIIFILMTGVKLSVAVFCCFDFEHVFYIAYLPWSGPWAQSGVFCGGQISHESVSKSWRPFNDFYFFFLIFKYVFSVFSFSFLLSLFHPCL